MFNETLLWYLILPVVLSVVVGLYLRHYRRLELGASIMAGVGGVLISALILSMTFYIGKGSRTQDVEILNGQVTGKTRDHGHYLRPYSCNCRSQTSCSGSGAQRTCSTTQVCDTCYEDRYTVTWACQSNIGPFTIEHLDRSSRSVYNTPDPARYTEIENGDPVSRRNAYTNYIKAVPASLFRPASAELRTRFADRLPTYPDQIHDIYRIRRVVQVGVSLSGAERNAWEESLSAMLGRLGPSKEVNAVLVFTDIADPDYFHALRDAWINGKKNDIVIVVGAPEFPGRAAWVDVMALSRTSMLQVSLRDALLGVETWTPDVVMPVVEREISQHFQRRSMQEFAYLDAEIDPPMWMMNLALFLIIVAYGFFFYLDRRNQGTHAYLNQRHYRIRR